MLFLKAPHLETLGEDVAEVPLMPGTTALGFAKCSAGRAFTIPSRWQLGGPTMVPENLSDSFKVRKLRGATWFDQIFARKLYISLYE